MGRPLGNERRKRCSICGVLTHDWEIINGGPVNCWPCGKMLRTNTEQVETRETPKEPDLEKSLDMWIARLDYLWRFNGAALIQGEDLSDLIALLGRSSAEVSATKHGSL